MYHHPDDRAGHSPTCPGTLIADRIDKFGRPDPAARAVDDLARARLNRRELRAIERDNAIALMTR